MGIGFDTNEPAGRDFETEGARIEEEWKTRIDLRAVIGGDAVLESGPVPGAEVVAVGAAELFGTEFGVGK